MIDRLDHWQFDGGNPVRHVHMCTWGVPAGQQVED